ncbi:uncharacterized protein VICG_01530 [Vittaforma corneae ATCC 50505]|uniref:Anaphase-promoting complex subunit 4 WD40 domain-containing protein n=1 Tax=Vittaforma corneae (strain ATCC 50505) TaxID=993615 RepID=L2GLP4_VITCO|nr:uncharacterized protein VICG_01530 [Vittaforma corneae ATCC 50505]ELA41425.1 hypothetical protein VICG_01530 [Vittaforma corneae ATCC 50505]
MHSILFQDKIAISDICTFQDKLIVSTYQNTLKVFEEAELKHTVDLPVSLTKICQFRDKLLGISYSQGLLVILNSMFTIISIIPGFKQPTFIYSNNKIVIITTLDSEILILKEKKYQSNIEEHLFEVALRKKTQKVSTALCFLQERICLGFESTLSVFDNKLNEVLTKDYSCCINSIASCANNLVIGLINGKIHFEDIQNFEESFAFNSHILNGKNTRIFYPVTQVYFDTFLLSSGYDGKVIKWDIANKKQTSIIIDTNKFVRKFEICRNYLYCLIEDDPNEALGRAFQSVSLIPL